MADRDDDIDAAFRDLVAQMGDDSAEGEALVARDAKSVDATLKALEDELKDPDDIPVDEALHLDGGKLSVALIVTPIVLPQALHSVLILSEVEEPVVCLKPWTAVWLPVEVTPTAEDELQGLLADSRPMPPRVDTIARIVSRVSKYGVVAMMSWLSEDEGIEPGVSGRITARRYVAGEPEETIHAGLLLGTMPQETEDLLLGRTKPSDYANSILPMGPVRKRPGPLGWLRRR